MTSFALHLIAMLSMFIDHAAIILFDNQEIMRMMGRIAFPIFAFLLVEGFKKTKSRKNYFLRLLMLAVISEPIFDYALTGKFVYWFHQNTIFTFIIAFGFMLYIEKNRKNLFKVALALAATPVVGFVTLIDYFYVGITTVMVFYMFDKRTKTHLVGQIISMTIIAFAISGNPLYEFSNASFVIPDEILSIFSLAFIWLYKGVQGYHKPWFRNFCYAFYPGHFALLILIKILL